MQKNVKNVKRTKYKNKKPLERQLLVQKAKQSKRKRPENTKKRKNTKKCKKRKNAKKAKNNRASFQYLSTCLILT